MAATRLDNVRTITLELIRKRSEHNEGLVSTLEEIALHQEELQTIGPYLGRTCGKTLQILLLQNNVISKMNPRDLKPMINLRYLNLALNNIRIIEGLETCEFLEKLDLTLNFIDLETLKESIDNLKHLMNLRELFLIGNRCYPPETGTSSNDDGIQKNSRLQGWVNCRSYIAAMLPQLTSLEGKEITKSERIVANQRLSTMTGELLTLANNTTRARIAAESTSFSIKEDLSLRGHTPEARLQMSHEMAHQKYEKEQNERANQPKKRGEKEFEDEHLQTISNERKREEEKNCTVRQRNDGKWLFRFNEDTTPGSVVLTIGIQRHLSTSLVDVDVHPKYISIIIKSKILRLVLPAEVNSDNSTAQRSLTTGELVITMPKIDPEENMISIRAAGKATYFANSSVSSSCNTHSKTQMTKANNTIFNAPPKQSLGVRMLEGSDGRDSIQALNGPVKISGLVSESHGGVIQESGVYTNNAKNNNHIGMREIRTTVQVDMNDNDESSYVANETQVGIREEVNDEPPGLW